MVDLKKLIVNSQYEAVDNLLGFNGYFASLDFQKPMEQEDIEIAARREALFDQKNYLARRFDGIGNLLQNPISSKQDMEDFETVYNNLMTELKEWKNRVERLVEDNKRILNHKY